MFFTFSQDWTLLTGKKWQHCRYFSWCFLVVSKATFHRSGKNSFPFSFKLTLQIDFMYERRKQLEISLISSITRARIFPIMWTSFLQTYWCEASDDYQSAATFLPPIRTLAENTSVYPQCTNLWCIATPDRTFPGDHGSSTSRLRMPNPLPYSVYRYDRVSSWCHPDPTDHTWVVPSFSSASWATTTPYQLHSHRCSTYTIRFRIFTSPDEIVYSCVLLLFRNAETCSLILPLLLTRACPVTRLSTIRWPMQCSLLRRWARSRDMLAKRERIDLCVRADGAHGSLWRYSPVHVPWLGSPPFDSSSNALSNAVELEHGSCLPRESRSISMTVPTVLIDLSDATHTCMSRDSALYHSIALAMLSLTGPS